MDRKTVLVLAGIAVVLFLVIRDPVGAAGAVHQGLDAAGQLVRGMAIALNRFLSGVAQG